MCSKLFLNHDISPFTSWNPNVKRCKMRNIPVNVFEHAKLQHHCCMGPKIDELTLTTHFEVALPQELALQPCLRFQPLKLQNSQLQFDARLWLLVLYKLHIDLKHQNPCCVEISYENAFIRRSTTRRGVN